MVANYNSLLSLNVTKEQKFNYKMLLPFTSSIVVLTGTEATLAGYGYHSVIEDGR